MAAQLEGPDTKVEMRRGGLGEIRVTVDGQDAFVGSRIFYTFPKKILAAVRARLGGPGGGAPA